LSTTFIFALGLSVPFSSSAFGISRSNFTNGVAPEDAARWLAQWLSKNNSIGPAFFFALLPEFLLSILKTAWSEWTDSGNWLARSFALMSAPYWTSNLPI
jgi:hypothetical protein